MPQWNHSEKILLLWEGVLLKIRKPSLCLCWYIIICIICIISTLREYTNKHDYCADPAHLKRAPNPSRWTMTRARGKEPMEEALEQYSNNILNIYFHIENLSSHEKCQICWWRNIHLWTKNHPCPQYLWNTVLTTKRIDRVTKIVIFFL